MASAPPSVLSIPPPPPPPLSPSPSPSSSPSSSLSARKLDPVTVLQDSIDNFSLSTHAALREVRDVSLNDIALSEKADEARNSSELSKLAAKTNKGGAAAKFTQQLSEQEEQARDRALVDRVAENVMAAHDKIAQAVDALPFKDSTLFEEVEELEALQREVAQLDKEIGAKEEEARELMGRVRGEVIKRAAIKLQ
ncbi:hypothetical protein TeGR_g8282 [Tetraparma gracilis]|uniref:Mediator of RNA polymerase II transcription subunit 21 n=1 Tax=Tetraparma gracilis TaxID=2962635 RepID=A0ABQ6NAN2_9STRA|nr:hypothetical protein TeGR_g8282 [Tetraparma gracilis]